MKIAKKLSHHKAKEFILSRGYARYLLADIFKISPLEVPLKAFPGESPLLKKGFGYLSFSHCDDVILIGWCNQNIGIDIERSDRLFDPKNIIKRFFNKNEKQYFKKLDPEKIRLETLKFWVLKEAAIKLNNGNLVTDLSNWIIENKFKKAYHEKLNLEIDIHLTICKSWFIGIANNSNSMKWEPIICQF